MIRIFVLTILLKSSIIFAANMNIEADELTLNPNGTIIAKDNIKINYLEHNLKANILKYNKNKNSYAASDNVIYNNKTLNYSLYADDLTSLSDFSKLKAKNAVVITNQNSYISAKHIKKNFTKINANNARFTNCRICKNGKLITPIWQVSAKNIEYDQNETNIKFKHAFFKLYNIPILYSPLFSYPAPNIKKQSGFLTPSINKNSNLGYLVTIPYFYNIAPNYDLTYRPTIMTSHDNIHHEAEFRYLTENSQSKLQFNYVKENKDLASYFKDRAISSNDNHNNKWLLKFTNNLRLSNNYNLEANIFETSDKAYLERYQSNYLNLYKSNINLNNITDKQEFYLSTTKFNEFNSTNIKADSQYNLPEISYIKSYILKNKVNLEHKLNFYNYNASNVVDRQNFKYSAYFKQDHITKNGLLLNYGIKPEARFYYNDEQNKSSSHIDSNVTLILNSKYPLMAQSKTNKFLITPNVNFIVSPKNSNSSKVTNLNSANATLNYSNVNSNNKISGTDLYEEGMRINYGINKQIFNEYLKFSNFIGQAYNFSTQEVSRSSGIKEKFSDIVGISSIDFPNKHSIKYQYKLRESDLNPYEQFFAVSLNYKKFKLQLSHLNNKLHLVGSSKNKEKFLNATLEFPLSDKITFSSKYQKNLLAKSYSKNSGSISSSNSLTIKGQCLDYIITFDKDFINTSNSENNYNINFTFSLKGL